MAQKFWPLFAIVILALKGGDGYFLDTNGDMIDGWTQSCNGGYHNRENSVCPNVDKPSLIPEDDFNCHDGFWTPCYSAQPIPQCSITLRNSSSSLPTKVGILAYITGGAPITLTVTSQNSSVKDFFITHVGWTDLYSFTDISAYSPVQEIKISMSYLHIEHYSVLDQVLVTDDTKFKTQEPSTTPLCLSTRPTTGSSSVPTQTSVSDGPSSVATEDTTTDATTFTYTSTDTSTFTTTDASTFTSTDDSTFTTTDDSTFSSTDASTFTTTDDSTFTTTDPTTFTNTDPSTFTTTDSSTFTTTDASTFTATDGTTYITEDTTNTITTEDSTFSTIISSSTPEVSTIPSSSSTEKSTTQTDDASTPTTVWTSQATPETTITDEITHSTHESTETPLTSTINTTLTSETKITSPATFPPTFIPSSTMHSTPSNDKDWKIPILFISLGLLLLLCLIQCCIKCTPIQWLTKPKSERNISQEQFNVNAQSPPSQYASPYQFKNLPHNSPLYPHNNPTPGPGIDFKTIPVNFNRYPSNSTVKNNFNGDPRLAIPSQQPILNPLNNASNFTQPNINPYVYFSKADISAEYGYGFGQQYFPRLSRRLV